MEAMKGVWMMRRRAVLLFVLVAVTLVVVSGVAFAVTRVGGPGSDALSGTDARDTLIGKGGNDSLDGRQRGDRLFGDRGQDAIKGGRGADVLDSGPRNESARDALDGGRGKDRLRVRNVPAAEDAVTCGRGFDRVFADRLDVVDSDCERVRLP